MASHSNGNNENKDAAASGHHDMFTPEETQYISNALCTICSMDVEVRTVLVQEPLNAQQPQPQPQQPHQQELGPEPQQTQQPQQHDAKQECRPPLTERLNTRLESRVIAVGMCLGARKLGELCVLRKCQWIVDLPLHELRMDRVAELSHHQYLPRHPQSRLFFASPASPSPQEDKKDVGTTSWQENAMAKNDMFWATKGMHAWGILTDARSNKLPAAEVARQIAALLHFYRKTIPRFFLDMNNIVTDACVLNAFLEKHGQPRFDYDLNGEYHPCILNSTSLIRGIMASTATRLGLRLTPAYAHTLPISSHFSATPNSSINKDQKNTAWSKSKEIDLELISDVLQVGQVHLSEKVHAAWMYLDAQIHPPTTNGPPFSQRPQERSRGYWSLTHVEKHLSRAPKPQSVCGRFSKDGPDGTPHLPMWDAGRTLVDLSKAMDINDELALGIGTIADLSPSYPPSAPRASQTNSQSQSHLHSHSQRHRHKRAPQPLYTDQHHYRSNQHQYQHQRMAGYIQHIYPAKTYVPYRHNHTQTGTAAYPTYTMVPYRLAQVQSQPPSQPHAQLPAASAQSPRSPEPEPETELEVETGADTEVEIEGEVSSPLASPQPTSPSPSVSPTPPEMEGAESPALSPSSPSSPYDTPEHHEQQKESSVSSITITIPLAALTDIATIGSGTTHGPHLVVQPVAAEADEKHIALPAEQSKDLVHNDKKLAPASTPGLKNATQTSWSDVVSNRRAPRQQAKFQHKYKQWTTGGAAEPRKGF